MRKDCDTCLHDEFGEEYCNDCYSANGKPPIKWEPAPFWTPDTNEDRIRAMSDEELAKFIVDEVCIYCQTYRTEECYNKCISAQIKWLNLPAE